jgi:Protein of unknown function (DUF3631)
MDDFEARFREAQEQVKPKVIKLEDSSSQRRQKITAEAAQINGAQLLDDVHQFCGRFVAYPSKEAQTAHPLWIAHSHLMDIWDSTPRLAFLSPEPESGKTRALEVTELMVPNPVEAVNVTPAYLFRKMGAPEGPPTILYDEIDTVFGPKAKDNEEIRGLLNAGHRRGAVAGRCVVRGKVVETEEISAYGAVAIAGIGHLPHTILSRCVVVKMRRRAPDEQVEPFRRRIHGPEGEALRDQLCMWAAGIADRVKKVLPATVMPEGIQDRAADLWEPLLAVADAAGGDWPSRARVAAVTLVTLLREANPSLGVRLLADLRQVFGEAHARSTKWLLEALHKLPESPWADIKGKPLDDRGLAARLRPYEVKPKPLRIGDTTLRGYAREELLEPWRRYLPPRADETAETEACLPDERNERNRHNTEGGGGASGPAAGADDDLVVPF